MELVAHILSVWNLSETLDNFMDVTNEMQLYRLIYYSRSPLHVSGDVFAYHQAHLTIFTVSGSIHSSGYRLVSWLN